MFQKWGARENKHFASNGHNFEPSFCTLSCSPSIDSICPINSTTKQAINNFFCQFQPVNVTTFIRLAIVRKVLAVANVAKNLHHPIVIAAVSVITTIQTVNRVRAL